MDIHWGRVGFNEGMFKEKIKEIMKKNRLEPGDASTVEMQEKVMLSSCNDDAYSSGTLMTRDSRS